MAGGASQGMMESVRLIEARRLRMTKVWVGIAAATVMAAMLAGGGVARADDRAPKGPAEDGTMPGLVKIAGEGEMNSHAFE